mmetsp:Transcript_113094/g.365304  ORF Transcript_113094/g.365304 Transcript_113094/m.365304 type:complete len:440 (-) Transcript_113094:267-1586(-)
MEAAAAASAAVLASASCGRSDGRGRCRWRAGRLLLCVAAALGALASAGPRAPAGGAFAARQPSDCTAAGLGDSTEQRPYSRGDAGRPRCPGLATARGAGRAAVGEPAGQWCLRGLAMLTISFLMCVAAPVVARAAKVESDVTGFADFAERGGAMDVNPSCFVTSCGKQTKECFLDDSRCLKGALCLSRCRGGQDCATQCFAEFGCKRLDAWLNCTVEKEKCVSVPPQLIDVKRWFETGVPKKLPNFDPASMQGTWYKARGYNPKYDCYLCQPNTFDYKPGASSLVADIQLRVPKLKSGGFWQNNVGESLVISAESERSTFRATGEIFGLSFDEEWYVLAGDNDYKLVAYRGKNLQDIYEGAFIYTRTQSMTPAVEEKAKAAAEANGYIWSRFCTVDNSCPAQTAVKDEPAKLDWADLPDLLEWFAPGTVPKQEFSGKYD